MLRLQGMIEQHQVLMLVDSGSSQSFISDDLAIKLGGAQQVDCPIHVRVADGGILSCTKEVRDYCWWVKGISFVTTLKVLPLGCYDVIIGMDWLGNHSPIAVDWKGKSLTFKHDNKMVCLHGVLPNV